MKKSPLISCLCVTRNKPELIARAIKCFKAQTYPTKELIIVYEDNDKDIQDFVKTINDPCIRNFEIPTNPKLTLGELRNKSIEFAQGEYFCQWDADDWYHSKRLALQMNCMTEMHKDVCFLTYWIIFDSLTKKAYLSRKRIWEGSMLCKKNIVTDKIIYPSIPKLEDFQFVEQLLEQNNIYPADLPHLYIYVYHGDNTWNYHHFELNFKAGKELSGSASTIIHDILDGKYSNDKASELMDSSAILGEVIFDYQFY